MMTRLTTSCAFASSMLRQKDSRASLSQGSGAETSSFTAALSMQAMCCGLASSNCSSNKKRRGQMSDDKASSHAESSLSPLHGLQ